MTQIIILSLIILKVNTDNGERLGSPLMAAISNGNSVAADKIIRHPKTDLNVKCRRSGEFPLIAVNIDEDTFERLLADPRVNPNQLDGQGRSPLMIAARDGDTDKVKILLRCPKVS